MLRLSAIAIATTMALTGCAGSGDSNQTLVNRMGSQLNVQYAVLDNHGGENGVNCGALGAEWAACNKATITLTNNGGEISGKAWTIYFHSIRQILAVENEQFKISHVTGDLHKLEPTDKFDGFQSGEVVEIPIIGEYWQLFETDFMPRWYVTAGDAKPKVISNTDSENVSEFSAPITGDNWKRTSGDKNVLMNAQTRYAKNQDVPVLPAQQLRGQILPTPVEVTVGKADASLANGINIQTLALPKTTLVAVSERLAQLGVTTSSAADAYPVDVKINKAAFKGKWQTEGAYTLKVTPQGAQIVGNDAAGAFYGLQSLISLIPMDGSKTIATVTVKDMPRFEHRGMHADVGRNFHNKESILRLLDQMAAYKLNKFHFHLSDDEGWRLEIPGLPELTDVGSQRCHDLSETQCLLPQLGSGPDSNNQGSGFYSKQDYVDILKYAKARNIEVIPELDMPAHARAAVVSMEARYKKLMAEGKEAEANQYRLLDPQDTSNTLSVQFYNRTSYLNPCLESSQAFVDKVIGEVAAMHKEAGMPLQTWHFGGDEAKNIRLGGGFQDVNAAEKVDWRGTIDQSKEDKPWAKSPVCQKMVESGKVSDFEHLPSQFAKEVSQLVNKHGITTMMAWQDGLKDASGASDFATKKTGVNFWDTLYWGGFDSANDWVNKGYELVVSNPDYVYFDMPYEVNPKESGYYWATRFSDERKVFGFAPDNLPQNAETSVDRDGNHFNAKSDKKWGGATGVQGQFWSESIRTDPGMEYMIFPRMLPLAERAWHQADWELDYVAGREFKGGETHYVNSKALNRDWARFANLLGQRELAKLDAAGVQYRLPVPGAVVTAGVLEVNTALPGLAVEYSADNGKTWQRYDAAAKPTVTGEVQVRTVSPDGKRASRVESVK